MYLGLEREERAVARRILLRAVQPGEDGGDARRPVPEDELHGPGDDPDKVDAVVDRLVDARLLTAGQEWHGKGRTLEIAHEALIDAWPRLRGWVDEARGWLLDHRRLTFAAQEWVAHDRQDDWLLAGMPLDEAHELVMADGRGDVDLHLSPVEHELVKASLEARQLVLAHEAERAEHRRDLERRSLRRLQALLAVVAMAGLTAGALWWDAQRDGRVALARELVAESAGALDEDPQLALLLALRARELAGSESTSAGAVDDALHAAIASNRMVAMHDDVGDLMIVTPGDHQYVTRRAELDDDGTWSLDVRDRRSGEVVRTLSGHGGDGPVWNAIHAPDDPVVAAGDRAGVLHLWNRETGASLGRIEGPNRLVEPHSFSPDVSLVSVNWAARRQEGRVRIVSVEDGRLVHEVDPIEVVPTDPVQGSDAVTVTPYGAWFSPDGSRLAVTYPSTPSARSAHALRILDAADFSELARHPVDAERARWSPDGTALALTGWGGSAVIDPMTGETVHPLPGGSQDDGWLQWSPDGSRLASSLGLVWETGDLESEPTRVEGVGTGWWATCADGDRLVTTDATNVAEFDLSRAAGTEVAWLPADGWQPGMDYDPGGDRLAVSGGDGRLEIWATSTWELESSVDAHEPALGRPEAEVAYGAIPFLDWSPDGELVAGSGFDDLEVRDARTGQERFTHDHGGGWSPVHFAPGANALAVHVDEPNGVVVLDVSGERLAMLPEEPGLTIESVRFSPDGRLLVHTVDSPAQEDGLGTTTGVRIWDWESEELVQTIDAPVYSVDWDPTGRLLAVAGFGLRLWDTSAQDWGQTLLPPDVQVQQAVFSGDGSLMTTCEHGAEFGQGHVRVFDVATGEQVADLADDNTGFCRVRFSPDDRHAAVSDGLPIGAVRVWTLDRDELVEIARSRVMRLWTDAECEQYLRMDTCPA